MHRLPYSLLFLLSFSLGCSSTKKPPVYPVQGQVVDRDNKPATGAVVIFHPQSPGEGETFRPVGKVDEKGNFLLTSYVEGDGAPSGKYSISILWPQVRRNPLEPEGPDRLQGTLSNPEKSPFRFEVQPQPNNQVPLIKLP